ncbi:MAG TPA: aldose 1-epimerase [Candidatus Polarisedimenticolia bacterium]|nr:aldose 1-epimerase [Candidatus Polarisedimenticolia bacterium]
MTELDPDAIVCEAGDARLEVSPRDGGRIRSLTVGGHELLVTSSPEGPIYWGCYPMAPWAGRLREGRFTFGGRGYEVRPNLPPHAIHGVVFDRPWRVDDERTMSVELDERWPFAGRVVHRFELAPDRLDVTLELHADEPMPGVVGWHPWLRRRLVAGDPGVRLAFEARTMLQRDEAGITTGVRVPPPPGPFDDAFTDLTRNPVLEWPGRLRLELSSSCPWWVVFDERPDAVCVEPQSGPPDAPNLMPEVVEPGRPLVHTMRWRWSPDDLTTVPRSRPG